MLSTGISAQRRVSCMSRAFEQIGGKITSRSLFAISIDMSSIRLTSQRAQPAHDATERLCLRRAGIVNWPANYLLWIIENFLGQALRSMANGNGGTVTCPRTKEVFAFKDAEKVYVM